MSESFPLTSRQTDILEFIRSFCNQRGFPPTVREIGDHFDIRSPNGVMCHLNAMVRKGAIQRDLKTSRGIRIVGDGRPTVTCPCCAAVLVVDTGPLGVQLRVPAGISPAPVNLPTDGVVAWGRDG